MVHSEDAGGADSLQTTAAAPSCSRPSPRGCGREESPSSPKGHAGLQNPLALTPGVNQLSFQELLHRRQYFSCFTKEETGGPERLSTFP